MPWRRGSSRGRAAFSDKLLFSGRKDQEKKEKSGNRRNQKGFPLILPDPGLDGLQDRGRRGTCLFPIEDLLDLCVRVGVGIGGGFAPLVQFILQSFPGAGEQFPDKRLLFRVKSTTVYFGCPETLFFQIWRNGIANSLFFSLRIHDLPDIRHKIGAK